VGLHKKSLWIPNVFWVSVTLAGVFNRENNTADRKWSVWSLAVWPHDGITKFRLCPSDERPNPPWPTWSSASPAKTPPIRRTFRARLCQSLRDACAHIGNSYTPADWNPLTLLHADWIQRETDPKADISQRRVI